MSEMLSDEQLANLKSLLEAEYKWPAEYLFKFVVPKEKLEEVKELFPDHPIETRESANGNYISTTITIELESADVVIAIYQKASQIKGLIAL